MGNGYRQVDNHLVIRCWLPNVQNGIAHFQCIFRFCSGKAFRRIFKDEMTRCHGTIFLAEFCTRYSQVQNFFLALLEHLFPLCHRSGIIQMDNRMLNTLQCFKGLCNDVFSCLRQNLNGDIIRNEILFNQGAAEFIFSFGGCRKTNFDFLKANID